MRILQVVPCYLPGTRYGGPVASVHGLSRALVRRGHEVRVLTTDLDGWEPLDPPPPERAVIDGVEVSYHAARAPRRIHRAPSMRAELRRSLPETDLVHVHGLYSWPVTAAAREAERAGVPFVVSPRGMLVRELVRRRGRLRKEAWIRAFDRRTLERAALVHATSEREAADLAAFPFRWPPVVTIENGVEAIEPVADADVSPAVLEALRGDDAILFMGRINWKKGLDRLLRALARTDRGRLLVAGPDDGAEAELRWLADDLGVAGRVAFLGEVAGADRAALFTRARLLALPSLHENFGNVVLEAMSAGLPAVVTPEVGAAPILGAAGAGRVTRGDPDALAATLAELLAAPGTLAAMGEAGRAEARRRFGWDAVAERFEEAFPGVAAEHRRAAA